MMALSGNGAMKAGEVRVLLDDCQWQLDEANRFGATDWARALAKRLDSLKRLRMLKQRKEPMVVGEG